MTLCFHSLFVDLQNLYLIQFHACWNLFCTNHSKFGYLVLSLSIYYVVKLASYYTSQWLNQHSRCVVEATYGVLMLCGEGHSLVCKSLFIEISVRPKGQCCFSNQLRRWLPSALQVCKWENSSATRSLVYTLICPSGCTKADWWTDLFCLCACVDNEKDWPCWLPG